MKLKHTGFKEICVKWTASFLNSRRQIVVVNGAKSDWADVTSGIPQGSVLGPILFIIFINDLPNVVSNCVQIFSDDTKLYAKIDVETATESIQTDLEKMTRMGRYVETALPSLKMHSHKIGTEEINSEIHYDPHKRGWHSRLAHPQRNRGRKGPWCRFRQQSYVQELHLTGGEQIKLSCWRHSQIL